MIADGVSPDLSLEVPQFLQPLLEFVAVEVRACLLEGVEEWTLILPRKTRFINPAGEDLQQIGCGHTPERE